MLSRRFSTIKSITVVGKHERITCLPIDDHAVVLNDPAVVGIEQLANHRGNIELNRLFACLSFDW